MKIPNRCPICGSSSWSCHQCLSFQILVLEGIVRIIDIWKKSWGYWDWVEKEVDIRLSGIPFCNGLPKLMKAIRL